MNPNLLETVLAGGIHFGVPGRTKDEALAAAVGMMRLPPEVDRASVLKGVRVRESLGSSGFGRQVAIPHCKVKGLRLAHPIVGIFFPSEPVEWEALDAQPVTLFFLVVGPDHTPGEHLRLQERLFRYISNATFLKYLRQCHNEQEVRELLTEAEETSFGGRPKPPPPPPTPSRARITLGPSGMHATPSMHFIKAVEGLDARLTLQVQGRTMLIGGKPVPIGDGPALTIDCRKPNVIELMALALRGGQQVLIGCEGPDAAKVVQRLKETVTEPGLFEGTTFELLP